jgi:hypothetical protein
LFDAVLIIGDLSSINKPTKPVKCSPFEIDVKKLPRGDGDGDEGEDVDDGGDEGEEEVHEEEGVNRMIDFDPFVDSG